MTSAVCHSYPAQRRLPLLTAGELRFKNNIRPINIMKLSKLFSGVFAAGLLVAVFTACKDDPDLVPGDEQGTETDGTVNMPTEDVVITSINYPAAILESGYDEVSERVIARMTSKSTAVTPDTKIILMNGKDDFTITPEIWNTLKEVYDRDGIIMIANPDEAIRRWLEKSLQFNNTSRDPDGDGTPDWDGNPAGESAYDIYAFTSAGNRLTLDDVYNPAPHNHEIVSVDSLGNVSTEILHHEKDMEPTQYEYGQFAESVARWANLVFNSEAKAKSAFRAASRANGSAEDFFCNGEFSTHISSIQLSNWDIDVNRWSKDAKGKTINLPFTLVYYVSAAYNFDDGCDYYYAELTEELQEKSIWKGIKKHHPWWFDGWSQAGWAIEQTDINLWLTADNPAHLNAPQLMKHSPENSVGSKTITTTEGWNLGGGGNFGFSKANEWGFSGVGSFTFNHVSTTAVAQVVRDMDVTYTSSLSSPVPNWEYTIPRFSLSGARVGGLSDVSDYHTGKKPITISQVAVWKEKVNPEHETAHKIEFRITVHHYMFNKLYGQSSDKFFAKHGKRVYIDLPEPGRHKYNYSLIPVKIHDNDEWIKIMTILNDVESYKMFKDFWKCSPRVNNVSTADNSALQYFNEHYDELQNNCKRITNIKNTYELKLYNMTTGNSVSDKSIMITPGDK